MVTIPVKGFDSGSAGSGATVTGGAGWRWTHSFTKTVAFLDSVPEKDTISILGLYGSRLKVGYGSMGGWDPFGPERVITRSRGNVLYAWTATSALYFTRSIWRACRRSSGHWMAFSPEPAEERGEAGVADHSLVNEEDDSMIFAGDVCEGSYARLMRENFDMLIDGASEAARISHTAIGCYVT